MKAHQKGFSLIETLVSLGLLASLLSLAMGLRTATNRNNIRSSKIESERNILENTLEKVLAARYEELPGAEINPGLKTVAIGEHSLYVTSAAE
ncbi:MAG: prepilin-type N-terminal cleavage/methylation domain-containing protein [Candidatus Margulisiibacteriota bacterium]|jgi:prepilin-type N-terminal cleavage/methylation domain-containing protein